MKITLKKHSSLRLNARLNKKARIRKKVTGTSERPRLCVFRSGKHMYAQIIDDQKGVTLASASSVEGELKETGKALAVVVGKEIAKAAKAKNINNVVFDRNGFIYHGRIQALAEGAREAGLNF
jgi:large subunit ribosomal protein L18